MSAQSSFFSTGTKNSERHTAAASPSAPMTTAKGARAESPEGVWEPCCPKSRSPRPAANSVRQMTPKTSRFVAGDPEAFVMMR